jgi:hypothetical protein
MDQNTTCLIVLNPTLNATLTQLPKSDWETWFPAITSIVVVILGGLATYYINNILQNRRARFEIKKQVYLEATDFLTNLQYIDDFKLNSLELRFYLVNASKEVQKEFSDLTKQLKVYKEFYNNGYPRDIYGSLTYETLIEKMRIDLLKEKKHAWKHPKNLCYIGTLSLKKLELVLRDLDPVPNFKGPLRIYKSKDQVVLITEIEKPRWQFWIAGEIQIHMRKDQALMLFDVERKLMDPNLNSLNEELDLDIIYKYWWEFWK